MKKVQSILLIFSISLLSCNHKQNDQEETKSNNAETEAELSKMYENKRFKKVTVKKISENSYRVTGKAQVFEATLNYVVEDGHYELAKGYAMTDAGAPDFGNFDFTVEVEKREPNSTLMLILFESSPKDGSRTHELFVPLKDN